MKQLTRKSARYFAQLDRGDRFALVALDPDDLNEIIAVMRFHREAGTDRAECAALVEVTGRVAGWQAFDPTTDRRGA